MRCTRTRDLTVAQAKRYWSKKGAAAQKAARGARWFKTWWGGVVVAPPSKDWGFLITCDGGRVRAVSEHLSRRL